MSKVNKFENEKYYDEVLAPRSTPWLVQVLEILQDGEWHSRDDVVREVAKLVPPGIAWRHMEKARIDQLSRYARAQLPPEQFQKWKEDPTNKERKYTQDAEHDLIRRGQRAVVIKAISPNKRIEKDRRKDGVWLRRIPLSDRMLESDTNRMRNWRPTEE